MMHLLSFILLTFSWCAVGETKNAATYTLFQIEGDQGSDHSNVILSFNRKLLWEKVSVESHGSFFQIKLPDTFVPKSGEFVDLPGEFFKKAVAFQSGPNEGALRVFVNGKAEEMNAAVAADILEDKIILTLSHKDLVKENADVGPAAVLKADQSAPPAKDLLQGKLLTVSIFCAVMLAGFLIMYFLKPFLRRRLNKNLHASVEEIRTLSAHPLSPKQKLVLVQVGGEKILLGLTSESITYIKAIDEKPAVSRRTVSQPAHVERAVEVAPASAPQNVTRAQRVATRPGATSKDAVKTEKPKTSTPSSMSHAERILNAQEGGATKLELSRGRAMVKKEDADKHTAVNDIRKLIRDKLSQMPQIS